MHKILLLCMSLLWVIPLVHAADSVSTAEETLKFSKENDKLKIETADGQITGSASGPNIELKGSNTSFSVTEHGVRMVDDQGMVIQLDDEGVHIKNQQGQDIILDEQSQKFGSTDKK